MANILHYIRLIVALIGAAIVLWGVLVSVWALLKQQLTRSQFRIIHRERLRHQLASYIILGLEFLIAADVVNTVIRPNIHELATLAGTVAIRTALAYFLEKEVDKQK